MRYGPRSHAIVGMILVGVMVSACTTSTADDPTTGATSSGPTASVVDTAPPSSAAVTVPTPTPSVIAPPTSAVPTTTALDPEAQEIADRAAVEAAWAHFWAVSDDLSRLSEADRLSAAMSVSVEPTLTQIMEQAHELEAEGLEIYGDSKFHPYWEQSIFGANVAVMGDCTDTSMTGSQVIATGEKRTVGVADNNTRATFARGSDGAWRVKEIFFLLDVPC